MTYFLIAALIFIGNSVPRKWGIDPEFKPYLEYMVELSEGNLQYKYLNINFHRIPSIGICYELRGEIFIDKYFWENSDYYGKILLLAHEVAHCQKSTPHIDGVDEWGCPIHFMHYAEGGHWCNFTRFGKYVQQMKEI